MALKKPWRDRPRLSRSQSATEWLRQFGAADQLAAAGLVDALLLLNDDDVASAVRKQLRTLAITRVGRRRKVALYSEREYAEAVAFNSEMRLDRDGVLRRRAVGSSGTPAVKPLRGRVRVGSEGWTAFMISQAVEASPRTYLNHPGPDRIRRHKVGQILVVTDFIGSGTRIRTMLDKFMNVPSVRAWKANGWLDFAVVAAAGTKAGIRSVETTALSRPCR